MIPPPSGSTCSRRVRPDARHAHSAILDTCVVAIPLLQHAESVVLIVIEGDHIFCVRQARPGAPGPTIELPSGKVEEGETAEDAARRELAEECELAAGALHRIGDFWVVPSYSTERAHVFHVTSFWRSPTVAGDDDEDIEVIRVPLAEAWERLSDGASLAALALWEHSG